MTDIHNDYVVSIDDDNNNDDNYNHNHAANAANYISSSSAVIPFSSSVCYFVHGGTFTAI